MKRYIQSSFILILIGVLCMAPDSWSAAEDRGNSRDEDKAGREPPSRSSAGAGSFGGSSGVTTGGRPRGPAQPGLTPHESRPHGREDPARGAGSGSPSQAPNFQFDGRGAAAWAVELVQRDRESRRAAERSLLEGGEEAIQVLAILLRVENEQLQERASALLLRLGKASIPAVLPCLEHRLASARRAALEVLRGLGEEAGDTALAVAKLLDDQDPATSMEAGRTLAFIGKAAAPAVEALAEALGGPLPSTRVMAAGALSSIGSAAHPAAPALIRALGHRDAALRRCAADALGAIVDGLEGERLAKVLRYLTRSLSDPDRHVRVSVAGALGRAGPKAASAVIALEQARQDPAVRAQANWALERITGKRPAAPARPAPPAAGAAIPAVAAEDWTGSWRMLGVSPWRNNVIEKAVPLDWNLRGRNLLWARRLGTETYGAPVVAGDLVLVGTGNDRPYDEQVQGRRGILVAFNKEDGRFLWQDFAPYRENSLQRLILPVTSSSPLVEGERLYYVTSQGQLRCLDTEGFLDGKNDGIYQSEPFASKRDADIVWEFDMPQQLGVFPHEAPNCSVAMAGNLLMVCTSNGVDEAHTNIPAPYAPSFIAIDKRHGRLVWQVTGPSPRVLHGQWSSPALLDLQGRTLALFGGGDGWLYALEAATGREVWRFDGNPEGAIWSPGGDQRGKVHRNNIIACPMIYQDTDHGRMVFLAMGQDPEHGQGRGRLLAIDPRGQGDVTKRRLIWAVDDIGRLIATPVAKDGWVYAADYNGFVHCFETKTGQRVWKHDLLAGVWGGLALIGQHLYVGDEDGNVTIFEAGRDKKVVGQMEMDASIWSVLSASDGVLYISTARTVFAIGKS